jgi:hypothetical protein
VTLSSNGKILAILLVFFAIIDILLTPLGFETRSSSKITSVGFATAPILLLGLALNVASLFLLFRKARLAPILAIIGSICSFPTLADQAGLLSSQPAPAAIADLELVNALVAIAAIFLATRVRREDALRSLRNRELNRVNDQ